MLAGALTGEVIAEDDAEDDMAEEEDGEDNGAEEDVDLELYEGGGSNRAALELNPLFAGWRHPNTSVRAGECLRFREAAILLLFGSVDIIIQRRKKRKDGKESKKGERHKLSE